METFTAAASHYRDGALTDVELIAKYVSEDLACVVEVERGHAKGRQQSSGDSSFACGRATPSLQQVH